MGVAESREPVTQKFISEGNTYNLKFGLCEMQGWRPDMEDATIIENDEDAKAMLFGVLDGHGGRQVSRFVGRFFSLVMKRLESYRKENYEQALIETFIKMDELLKHGTVDLLLKKNDVNLLSKTQIQEISTTINNESSYSFEKREASLEPNKSNNSDSPKKEVSFEKIIPFESKFALNTLSENNNLEKNEEDLIKELKSLTIENHVKKDMYKSTRHAKSQIVKLGSFTSEIDIEKLISFNMGTTANILFIKSKVFFLANVGDSRAVLYKGGKTIRLNEEHKPTMVSEQSRIAKAGFHIISNRIDGKLNLTRAIGDFMFKNNKNLKRHEQAVTVYPEVKTMKITKDMEFIVIACDGVWDCVDDDKLCDYISKNLKEGKRITEIIANLYDQIISKTEKST